MMTKTQTRKEGNRLIWIVIGIIVLSLIFLMFLYPDNSSYLKSDEEVEFEEQVCLDASYYCLHTTLNLVENADLVKAYCLRTQECRMRGIIP